MNGELICDKRFQRNFHNGLYASLSGLAVKLVLFSNSQVLIDLTRVNVSLSVINLIAFQIKHSYPIKIATSCNSFYRWAWIRASDTHNTQTFEDMPFGSRCEKTCRFTAK